MKSTKYLSLLLAVGLVASAGACAAPAATTSAVDTATQVPAADEGPTAEAAAVTTTAGTTAALDPSLDDAYADVLTFNNAAWQYDADNDVYYQIGVQYSATPETLDYETLGIYVPGAYMSAVDNGDGTFTATLNDTGTVYGYTAVTAPMVFPVNTPGYTAQASPTTYNFSSVSSYMQAGFIYVEAGMRGRDNGYDSSGTLTYSGGAPWGVTDLKAAVRYVRYNDAALPGDTNSVFIFGMSGGGAQTSLMGASGDSELYFPYLKSIGAAMYDAAGAYISDAVTGAMAWCPITSLDYADAAYEWNMGQYSTDGTRADGTFTAALSDDLANAYAEYINQLGLVDENDAALTLTATTDGVFTAGSYYDYLKGVVEQSLNNFLADTTFPYTPSSGGMGGHGGGFPGGGFPGGGTPPTGDIPTDGTMPTGELPAMDADATATSSTTYETAQAYIDSLNADGQWVVYDAASNTATITSVADFVTHLKTPSKSVGAFDDLALSQAENNVFGNDESDSLHFDVVMAGLLTANQEAYALLTNWDASTVDAYNTDLQAVDKLGNSIAYRMNMYNPMYYIEDYYEGYQTSKVAPYWRINTGIDQGDTATTVEMNLALALQANDGVKSVDFTTVWGQAHTMAERTGDSTTNFIAWVNGIVQS